MESSRLKNIIILTLALVNVFLLGTLAVRQGETLQGQRRTTEGLIALFAADGVTLEEDAVSFAAPPVGRTLNRNLQAEQTMAAFFLGEDMTVSDEGGGINTGLSDLGQAMFRASGSFEIVGHLGRDPDSLLRQFCKEYGYGDPTPALDASGSGTVSAPALYEDYPVVDCAVEFLVEQNELRSVSGIYLPTDSLPMEESGALSCATALSAFLEARRSSGAVVTSVTGAYPCYALQSSAAAAMTLVPSWCILTDTVNYYVNCSTAAVTHD